MDIFIRGRLGCCNKRPTTNSMSSRRQEFLSCVCSISFVTAMRFQARFLLWCVCVPYAAFQNFPARLNPRCPWWYLAASPTLSHLPFPQLVFSGVASQINTYTRILASGSPFGEPRPRYHPLGITIHWLTKVYSQM